MGDCTWDSISIFTKFIDKDIIEEIVKWTNSNEQLQICKSSKVTKWNKLTTIKIEDYFGVHLHMGIIKLPRITDYWSTIN